jgi:sugar/nucleoside kinase (ribokinase family)
MREVLLLGGVIFDKILTIASYPPPGSDTLITSEKIIPSGCALNTAVTLRSYGIRPHIVGTIGEADKKDITGYMQRLGLPTDGITTTDAGETGYCLTMVDPDAERTFFTKKGVESLFSVEAIPGNTAFGMIYLTGYYLLEPQQAEMVSAYLNTVDAPIIFDPGVLVSEIDQKLLQEILNRCYAITPNETEYELLHSFDLSRIQLIVVKRGKGAITTTFRDQRYTCYPYDVNTIDTTGAGDCFVGTLIAQLLEDRPLLTALQTASAAASYMTTIHGPHARFDPDEIETIRDTTRELRS